MKNFIKQNWFKLGILVILGCAVYAFSQNHADTASLAPIVSSEYPTSTSEVQTQASPSMVSDIDLQTKCASQAKLFFEYYVPDPQEQQNDEYTNHYNSKLSKCFILIKHGITVTNGAFGIYTKNFFDAIEKKQYGSYGWQPDKVKKYWEVPPFDCSMYPDGNQDAVKTCSSEGEFDAFVSTYMEN